MDFLELVNLAGIGKNRRFYFLFLSQKQGARIPKL
jgi:hypothetical protein